MRGVSLVSIILGILSALIGFISRVRVAPLLGLESRAFAGIAVLFLLLAIAINTLPKE